MDKREQTILFLVLAAAGMLLLLLYSPWGSPDLYNNKVYFAENQGVNFNNRIISSASMHVGAINANVGSLTSVLNAPKNGSIGDSQNTELNVPDNYSKRKAARRVSSSKFNGANSKSNRIIAYNKISKSSIAKSRREAIGGTSNGGNASESTSSNSGSFASNNINGSSVGGSFNQSAGVSAVNVDLTLFSDSTVVQATDSAQRAGEEGDPEPVPVPEGWGFLLALAAIYIVIKRKMFYKIIETKSIS